MSWYSDGEENPGLWHLINTGDADADEVVNCSSCTFRGNACPGFVADENGICRNYR